VVRARAAGLYVGSLREILHALKYRGHRSVARRLSVLMRQAGADLLTDADASVAVPMHYRKAWSRGFNQAADLARGLPLRQLPALRRRRATSTQAGLNAAQRARNVRGAFAPSRRVVFSLWLQGRQGGKHRVARMLRQWILRRWSIDGLTVVLVDDVRTTGATLEECGRVLTACGAREVRALAAALVVPP
jgi:predicted amidophosphoribosyltransferase